MDMQPSRFTEDQSAFGARHFKIAVLGLPFVERRAADVRKPVLDLSDTVRRTCTVITGAW